MDNWPASSGGKRNQPLLTAQKFGDRCGKHIIGGYKGAELQLVTTKNCGVRSGRPTHLFEASARRLATPNRFTTSIQSLTRRFSKDMVCRQGDWGDFGGRRPAHTWQHLRAGGHGRAASGCQARTIVAIAGSFTSLDPRVANGAPYRQGQQALEQVGSVPHVLTCDEPLRRDNRFPLRPPGLAGERTKHAAHQEQSRGSSREQP